MDVDKRFTTSMAGFAPHRDALQILVPSPLVGEGQGEGAILSSPSPLSPPIKGGETSNPPYPQGRFRFD